MSITVPINRLRTKHSTATMKYLPGMQLSGQVSVVFSLLSETDAVVLSSLTDMSLSGTDSVVLSSLKLKYFDK